MKAIVQFHYLKKDVKRYLNTGISKKYLLFEYGLYVVVFYRISRFLFLVNFPIIRLFCKFISFLILKFVEFFFHTCLPPSTDIGPGFYIGHPFGILVSPNSKIGKNFTITHYVTIGARGLGVKGSPILGDNVFIGSGAKIIGPVKIGNNVRIGTNSVVLKDVPNNTLVVGVPAKIVKVLK